MANAGQSPPMAAPALCEAAEAMLALREREEEYRRATTNAPARWSAASRGIAARRVRDASSDLQQRLDRYVSARDARAEEAARPAEPAARRNA